MRHRLRTGIAALVAASAFTVLPVHAGTNGQELSYNVRCNANWSETLGYNQNGQYQDDWFETPAADPGNSCWQSPWQHWSWWWGGTVTVNGWWSYDGNSGSQEAGSSNYYIPWSQQDSDWVQVGTPS